MRKIVVLSFTTLDGIIQSPGGPDEDRSDGFTYGGWAVPFFDEYLGNVMGKQMSEPFDLLLGRKTYEIFASYWPHQKDPDSQEINNATKYVISTTLHSSDWQKTIFFNNDVVNRIKALKKDNGPDLQVHGSSKLIQTLLEYDLIDEFWLKIFPITIGNGKRLFGNRTMPSSYTVSDYSVSPSGVIIASYIKSGEVKTATFQV